MNKLRTSLKHLEQKMQKNTDDAIVIVCNGTRFQTTATIVSAAPVVQQNGVKTTSNKHRILIPTAELDRLKLRLFRGIKIEDTVGKRTFEIVIEKDGLQSPEEQYGNRTIVHAKLISCN